MKLKNALLTWYVQFFFPALHDDLTEMSVHLWWKAEKDDGRKDLIIYKKTIFLEKLVSFQLKMFTNGFIHSHLNDQMEKLNDDFIDFFGFDPEHLERLYLIKDIQCLKSEFARTGDNGCVTQWLILEIRLANITRSDKEINEYELLANVELLLGNGTINPQLVSVIDFYSKKKAGIKKNEDAITAAAKQKQKWRQKR